jgi:16S rRNA (uracil1498-N3)-methyltransferase
MLRVPLPGLAARDQVLAPEVAHYVVRVRRLAQGDRFVAFDPSQELEADAEIIRVTPHEVVARVGALRPAPAIAVRDVTWIQALPKGEKMDGIVRDATELGATRIVPVSSAFTVVKLDASRRKARRERWERIAREAARQCGRGDTPAIHDVLAWQEGLALQAGGSRFCLYERATEPLGPLLLESLGTPAPLVFAAGPEGGLRADEVEQAIGAGFGVVSLGAFVMRTETVAAATLGALQVLARMSPALAQQ